jgi:hypothetical protein
MPDLLHPRPYNLTILQSAFGDILRFLTFTMLGNPQAIPPLLLQRWSFTEDQEQDEPPARRDSQ